MQQLYEFKTFLYWTGKNQESSKNILTSHKSFHQTNPIYQRKPHDGIPCCGNHVVQ